MISTVQKKIKWQDFHCLHPQLIKNLYSHGLDTPTSIQSEVYQNYKHYYDFLVASQTGSGKTLAFAAPIISDLINIGDKLPKSILCLVLTPTRQLAQQIQQVIATSIKGTNIVQTSVLGGLSIAKQIRVIQQKHPNIIIGTPGRISQLISQQVIKFSNLKYLVIDEADRMIQMGHYVELDQILNKIFNPKVQQTFQDDLNEIMNNMQQQQLKNNQFYIMQNGKKKKLSMSINSMPTDKLFEIPDGMFQIANQTPIKQKKNKGKKTNKKQIIDQVQQNQQHMQILAKMKRKVFFISATLTRQFKGTKYHKKKNVQTDKKKKSKDDQDAQYTPKLKALLSRIKFDSKPKIIDQSAQLFLPQKLKEMYCFCDNQLQKIAIMICYLRQIPSNSKVIIFANTIKASKRVQFFIQHAGINNSTLHSHMIQKQRLTKLQKFKKAKDMVLISTDVAARGLDFQISHVIQYSVPVNGDTYVHRVGRTARANRSGQALTLISKKQANKWQQIVEVLSGSDSTHRKAQKYSPLSQKMKSTTEQVQRYEWIRINQQKQQNKRIAKLHQMQAEQFGLEIEEDQHQKKVDEEEERIMNHKISKKIKKYQKQAYHNRNKPGNLEDIGNGKVWKKNKLVMSLDQIKKLL